jgi:putative endonuclease
MTSNLIKRVYEHKNNLVGGLTKKYNVHILVWYELHRNMRSAIQREKQIKAGSRMKKLDLIKEKNPEWRDLYKDIM